MEKHGPALAYKHAIEALQDDPEVDGVIVHLFAGLASGPGHETNPVGY